jgi:hypothetical protein
MIHSELEYQEAVKRREAAEVRLENHRKCLISEGMSSEHLKNVMDPLESFHMQLVEDIEAYEHLSNRLKLDKKALEECLPGWTVVEKRTSASPVDGVDYAGPSSDFQAPDIEDEMRNFKLHTDPDVTMVDNEQDAAKSGTYFARLTRTGPNDGLVGTKTVIMSHATGKPVGIQG